jgi:mannosylfructose-6-phosphate phosphatase
VAGQSLIVTDVDGTLLGDDGALAEFLAWWEPRRAEVRLALNSGRFTDSLLRSIVDYQLPMPDALIGGVGTEMIDGSTGAAIDGWPPGSGRWDAARVRQVLAADDRLTLQPIEFQSNFKVSYYAHQASGDELLAWKARLQGSSLDVRLVYSSDRDLDVLPAGVDKGAAAAFLARRLDIPPSRVIACGDTLNDLAMFQHGFCGVVVANALAELRRLDRPDVYHCRRGFAGGILEGAQHWLAKNGRPSSAPNGDRGTP